MDFSSFCSGNSNDIQIAAVVLPSSTTPPQLLAELLRFISKCTTCVHVGSDVSSSALNCGCMVHWLADHSSLVAVLRLMLGGAVLGIKSLNYIFFVHAEIPQRRVQGAAPLCTCAGWLSSFALTCPSLSACAASAAHLPLPTTTTRRRTCTGRTDQCMPACYVYRMASRWLTFVSVLVLVPGLSPRSRSWSRSRSQSWYRSRSQYRSRSRSWSRFPVPLLYLPFSLLHVCSSATHPLLPHPPPPPPPSDIMTLRESLTCIASPCLLITVIFIRALIRVYRIWFENESSL